MALSSCASSFLLRTFGTPNLLLLQKFYIVRQCSTSKSISQVLALDAGIIGKVIKNTGWVRSIRSHKGVAFLDVNDGSCLGSLQVVAKSNVMHEGVTFGCSVEVEGTLVSSKSSGQSLELRADHIRVIGPCDAQEFPFKPKSRYHGDYLRQFPHLRSRTNAFGALLRIRNAATMATHKFFQERDFLNVHTPIITSNDCEGAGELFTVESMKTDEEEDKSHFFEVPAYLTVSGQLHLEAIACSHSKVYTMGPTFRAENSRSRKHLSEFYMVEAEITNTNSIEDITQLIEDLVKETTKSILETNHEDTHLFHVATDHRKTIEKMLLSTFNMITYSDAVSLLEKHSKKFTNKPFWGCDLNTEHEVFLVQYFDDTPVFVVNFPSEIKAFYARDNNDGPHTVSAVDLLVPGIGELVGGSLREERPAVLEEKLQNSGLTDDYQWYLDLRRFGSVPHGGFGMGFERYLQFLLGVENIKDVIPFARYTHSCRL